MKCVVHVMKQVIDAKKFERILFSCEEMCYSISLALSDNQDDALDLEREIMECLWNLMDSEDGKNKIKRKIIKVLHKRFQEDNRTNHNQPGKQGYPWKKEGLHVVRNAEREIEN